MMDTEKEVKSVISELQSGRGSSLYGALIMLRTTLIKSRGALSHLVQLGAVKLLIQLLEDHRRHVNQTKTTDIVMSILANLCMEEDVREKVVSCGGVSVIARVTLSSEQESIQNRGVRALANLAQDVNNCEKIVSLEVPAFVAKRLMESEDVECRSTFCRALQLFGQTSKGVKRLVEDTQAIQALAALLKLDNKKLALKSLRILSEFSAVRCCPSFTGQILAANVLEELVTLADDEDNSAASYSLSIVLRLCEQELMRPALGSAGVISLLVKLMSSDRAVVNKVAILNALCLCTKEAVNRIKIRDAGGLEVLMSALKERNDGTLRDGQFSVLYDRIISSLVNFLYSDDCLGKLLELGLVRIITEHLKRCCQFSFVLEDLRQEIGSLALAVEVSKALQTGESRLSQTDTDLKEKDLDTEAGAVTTEENVLNSVNVASCSSTDITDTAFRDTEMREATAVGRVSIPCTSSEVSEVPRTSTEHLKLSSEEVDPLIIDSSIMTDSEGMVMDVDSEDVNPSSPDKLVDLPLPPTTVSRHTYSINSPTYQAETSWKLEDYTSGVTCKSFHQEQDALRMSPPHPPPHIVNVEGMVAQAPYSPLSAGASYYSPAQSSPSHSVALSPLQSLSPNSPSSAPTSNQASPTWSFTSPEHHSPSYPGAVFSPPYISSSQSSRSPSYQNQFSPLSNAFPTSPLPSSMDRNSLSPAFSSQASQADQLGSQESTVPYFERPLDSPGIVMHYRQDDHPPSPLVETLSPRFSVVPLSQDTVTSGTPVYSASEDDDDDDDDDNGDDDNDGCDASDKPKTSLFISEKFLHSASGQQNTSKTSEKETKNMKEDQRQSVDVLASNKRCLDVENMNSPHDSDSLQKGRADLKSPKRRKLNHDLGISESVTEICDQAEPELVSARLSRSSRHISSGFIPNCCNEDEMSTDVSQESVVNTSSVSLKLDNVACFPDGIKDTVKTKTSSARGVLQEDRSSQTQDSTVQMRKGVVFQRMASYPGKGKLSARQVVGFKRFLSSSVSPTARHGTSPLAAMSPLSRHGASPLITDSPYRSPYPETIHSPVVSQDERRELAGTLAHTTGTRDAESKTAQSAAGSSQKQGPDVQDEHGAPNTSTVDRNPRTRPDLTSNTRSDNDARIKKILRTTESNILILLARISQKTNPTQFLVEAPVLSCLLGYISSSPNPIRRCCRILSRLCSNPHCFERLVLLQMPVLIVRSLVLEEDGTFPTLTLSTEGNSRDLSDLLPSSQGSEGSGSQASEFGRKLDFEFGGDAYSRMSSHNFPSLGAYFRDRPSLSVDSQSARDSLGGSGDIYETGSGRTEARVRIGLGLIHALGAVAMSRYGEGEIQHLLTRRSVQDKLACTVSMLHLQVGWGHFTRRQFILKYNLWDKVLPTLFVPEASLAREAIVAALSLNLRLDNPVKMVKQVVKLPICSDLNQDISQASCTPMLTSECSSSGQDKVKAAVVTLSLKKTNTFSGSDQQKVSALKSYNSVGGSERGKVSNQTPDEVSNPVRICRYRNMADKHDVQFVVQEGEAIHKLGVCRETLTQKSDVFAAMLGGSYVESSKSEIVIPDVSVDGFEFILHYLHGCMSGCVLIDSLSLPTPNSETEAVEPAVSCDTDSNRGEETVDTLGLKGSDVQGNRKGLTDDCDNVDRDKPCDSETQSVGKDSEMCCEDVDHIDIDVSMETSRPLESATTAARATLQKENQQSYLSPLLDFGESQDSLSSLTLEDDPKPETSRASRKLSFQNIPLDDKKTLGMGTEVETEERQISNHAHVETVLAGVAQLVNSCADILELADRFLLNDLVGYITSVLSHVCLCPQTAEDIFHLACFYKLDSLAVDCVREVLLSNLPSHETAALFVDLASDGYREQAECALRQLLNSLHMD